MCAVTTTYQLHLACNNHRTGIHQGHVEHVGLCVPGSLDRLLDLEGPQLPCGLIKADGGAALFLRLGKHPYRLIGYTEGIGNWCWDAAHLQPAEAATILNVLRAAGWHPIAGWAVAWAHWNSRQPFTAAALAQMLEEAETQS
jgi:hypothetical protein